MHSFHVFFFLLYCSSGTGGCFSLSSLHGCGADTPYLNLLHCQ